MLRKIALSLIVLAVVSCLVWFYLYYRSVSISVRDPFDAIPKDVIFIATSNDIRSTWNKLKDANIMWDDLLGSETFREFNADLQYIDSLLTSVPEAWDLLSNNALTISIHPGDTGSLALLLTCAVADLRKQEVLDSILFFKTFRNIQGGTSEANGNPFEGISVRSGRKCHWSVTEGILLMSFNEKLLLHSLEELRNNEGIGRDPVFAKMRSISGKNADGTLLINVSKLPALYAPLLKDEFSDTAAIMAASASWCELDLSLKSNNLSLNGYTITAKQGVHYLDLFNDQEPCEMELPGRLPSSTSMFAYYGISGINSFLENYREFLQRNDRYKLYEGVTEKWKNELGIDAEGSLLGWADHEFAFGYIQSADALKSEASPYAVFLSADTIHSHDLLSDLADRLDSLRRLPADSARLFGFTLRKIRLNHVFTTLLGAPFDQLDSTCYMEAGDLVYFANDFGTLAGIASALHSGRTLSKSKKFQSFTAENFSPECNMFFYTSIAGSYPRFLSLLRPDLEKDLFARLDLLLDFEACGLQITAGKGMFYTSIHLRHNPVYKNEIATVWETELDTTVRSKPLLVTNHNNGVKEILVQDEAGTLYLLSNSGKLLWKKMIGEKIMGQVQQVDAFRNSKLQFLFNTRSAIHLLDRNGNYLDGFPIKPGSEATSPLALFDYEGDLDYRIVLATSDKKIFNYTIKGKKAPKWTLPVTDAPVIMAPKHLRTGGKDIIIACDANGKLHTWNRRGEEHTLLKERLPAGLTTFYMDKGRDLTNTYFLASDSTGNIHKVNGNGRKEIFGLNGITHVSQFLFADVTGDNVEEYLVVSGKAIHVFAPDKKNLFTASVKGSVKTMPMVFRFAGGANLVGLYDEAGEVWLFDVKGQAVRGTPYRGTTPFSIGDMNKEGIYNLVTGGESKKIYVYALE